MTKEEYNKEVEDIATQKHDHERKLMLARNDLNSRYATENNTFNIGDMIVGLNGTGVIKSMRHTASRRSEYSEMIYTCEHRLSNGGKRKKYDTITIWQSNVRKVLRKGEKVFRDVEEK